MDSVSGVLELTTDAIFGNLGQSVFVVSHSQTLDSSLPAEMDPFVLSFGLPAGTNPSEGVLSWAGIVVGTDVTESDSRGHTILGDVEISIADVLDSLAEISFTNLFDIDANTSRSSMTWSEVEVSDGAFVAGGDGSRVEGTFYGPGHLEVGGVFERDGILGAYAAQRGDVGALSMEDVTEPNLDDPIEFLGFLLGGFLVGDFPFGTSGPTATTQGSSAGLVQEGALESLSDDILSEFFQMTIGLQGALPDGGLGTGRFEVLNKVRAGVDDFEIEIDLELTGFFGWLENGIHTGGQSRIVSSEGLGGFPLPEINSRSQTAVGTGLLSSPVAGSARWDGVMVGEDVSDTATHGNAIRGDVSLTIDDFSRSEVHLEFTNVVDIDAGRSLSDIAWTEVPMSKGIFRSEQGGDMIEGFFLGPNHEEAAGIFERDGIFGTFGAVRASSADGGPALGQTGSGPGLTSAFQALAFSDDPSFGVSSGISELLSSVDGDLLISLALQDAVHTESFHNGILLTEFRTGPLPLGEGTVEFDTWGGWLGHGFFAVSRVEHESLDEVRSLPFVFGAMLGKIPESNPPSGSARWTGAMLGIDVGGTSTHGNRVRGEASITVDDLHYLNVDIAFKEIVDLATNSRRGDMQWWGIPLFEGAFEASTDDDRISGQFYGPEHEEVGGVFLWREIVGSFGAKRMQP